MAGKNQLIRQKHYNLHAWFAVAVRKAKVTYLILVLIILMILVSLYVYAGMFFAQTSAPGVTEVTPEPTATEEVAVKDISAMTEAERQSMLQRLEDSDIPFMTEAEQAAMLERLSQ